MIHSSHSGRTSRVHTKITSKLSRYSGGPAWQWANASRRPPPGDRSIEGTAPALVREGAARDQSDRTVKGVSGQKYGSLEVPRGAGAGPERDPVLGRTTRHVNKAQMFDNDFQANNGEAHAKKIITMLCNNDTAMTKTLGLIRKLLELHPPI